MCAQNFKNVSIFGVEIFDYHGYKKTGISKFQSEPVLETPLTRDEQVQNLLERFDRFVCSDSDEDW